MVSFELGKEIERDVFRLVKSEGKRKDSESSIHISEYSSKEIIVTE